MLLENLELENEEEDAAPNRNGISWTRKNEGNDILVQG